MRIFKKSFLRACVALAVMLMLPSMNVYAADTYTVTFRPGNVGYFALTANPEGDKQQMAQEVAASLYGDSATVTKNGAIKVEVSAGAAAPAAPTYIQTQEGYFVKEVSGWGPGNLPVDRDLDFVVDYARLVDGVEYTVEYVDSVSKESIAPLYITRANIGEERTVTAPAQIVISGGAIYNLRSEASITRTLDADASKNVFTFEYTAAPSETVIEEVVITRDGEIVTTTEYITTTIDNGTTFVGGGAAAGGAGAGGGAAEGGEAAGGNEAVEIIDEDTPLAGAITEEPSEGAAMVEIGEEEVPLASGQEPFANMALIGASIFGAGAVLAASIWLFMRKKRATVEASDAEE